MARGICLKRHRFQSVDTKPETGAPALAGRGGVVRVCVFCGSSSQRQSGGVVWCGWCGWLAYRRLVCNPGPCASPDLVEGEGGLSGLAAPGWRPHLLAVQYD